jgi:hypothetical protein
MASPTTSTTRPSPSHINPDGEFHHAMRGPLAMILGEVELVLSEAGGTPR